MGRFLRPPTSTGSAPASVTPPALRPVTKQPCALSKQRMRPGSVLTRTVQFRVGAIFLLGITLFVYRCSVTFVYFSGFSYGPGCPFIAVARTPDLCSREPVPWTLTPLSAGRCASAASCPFPWQQPCSLSTVLTLGLCYPGTPPTSRAPRGSLGLAASSALGGRASVYTGNAARRRELERGASVSRLPLAPRGQVQATCVPSASSPFQKDGREPCEHTRPRARSVSTAASPNHPARRTLRPGAAHLTF